MDQPILIDHPLVQHKLSLLRRKSTETHVFRNTLTELGTLVAYEMTRDLPVVRRRIETPMSTTWGSTFETKNLVLVAVLRAGSAMVEGMLRVLPSARVGHIGLYREPTTLVPVEYYCKLPDQMERRLAFVVAPVLATGNSAVAALERVKHAGAFSVKFACVVAAQQGVDNLRAHHPEVPVYAAAVDPELDAQGYILPGLGDAGDRMFGTR
ncbi:MAG: uracil phosphoribosyltransferase [Proteobacteria bacterium]|nr:uracil phosphoribosyltransferase [Pseudomonadota bacterium]